MSKPEKYRRSTEIMLLDTVLMEEKMLYESDIEPKIDYQCLEICKSNVLWSKFHKSQL